MARIVVVNESTVVTDQQVKDCMAALAIQHDMDFAPLWGTGPNTIKFIAKGDSVPTDWWELVFADDSDQVGALGYHEITSSGAPIGFVFVKEDIDNGDSWTVTASHEFLEMMADPHINTIVEVDNPDGSFTFYAKEVCDACEDDSQGYEVDLLDGQAILVSDFVLPGWFVPTTDETMLDFRSLIKKPLDLLQNGYIGVLNVAAGPEWGQINGELTKRAGREIAKPFHRRHRRALHKSQWKRSERG